MHASKGLATARQPASDIQYPDIQYLDIYVPRVHPLGEWFHVSLVLWGFEWFGVTTKHARRPSIQAKRVWGDIGGPIHLTKHTSKERLG
jgi:hypothetical protein